MEKKGNILFPQNNEESHQKLRINIIRTLGNSQTTTWMLNQEKKWLQVSRRALWHFNLLLPHPPHSPLVQQQSGRWQPTLLVWVSGAGKRAFSKEFGCLFWPTWVAFWGTNTKGLSLFHLTWNLMAEKWLWYFCWKHLKANEPDGASWNKGYQLGQIVQMWKSLAEKAGQWDTLGNE